MSNKKKYILIFSIIFAVAATALVLAFTLPKSKPVQDQGNKATDVPQVIEEVTAETTTTASYAVQIETVTPNNLPQEEPEGGKTEEPTYPEVQPSSEEIPAAMPEEESSPVQTEEPEVTESTESLPETKPEPVTQDQEEDSQEPETKKETEPVTKKTELTTEKESEKQTEKETPATSASEKEREKETKKDAETVQSGSDVIYLAFRDRNQIPRNVEEGRIIQTSDGTYNVRYSVVVQAVRNAGQEEMTMKDAEDNEVTVSAYNTAISDTGYLAIRTKHEEDETLSDGIQEVSVRKFVDMANTEDPDKVYEYVKEEQKVLDHTDRNSRTVNHTHQYVGHVEKEATCTKDGVYTFVCSVCGERYSETIKAAGHNLMKSKITREPTCTKEGIRTYYCTKCDYKETEELPKTEHYYFAEVTRRPTCQKEGIRTYTCAFCGDEYTEAIPMLTHEWVPMKTYTLVCDKCGESFSADGLIEEAARLWKEHLDKAHAGENATAHPYMQEGTGEVCIHCGLKR